MLQPINLRKLRTSWFGTALLVSAVVWNMGCDRTQNQSVGNWQKGAEGSQLKLKCASKDAFNPQKVIESSLKYIQDNTNKSASADPSAAYIHVIRTYAPSHSSTIGKDKKEALDYHMMPFRSGMPSELTPDQYVQSPAMIRVSDVNCGQLQAEFSIPGLEEALVGKIKSISSNSITLLTTDPDKKTKTEVKITRDLPKQAEAKKAYLDAKKEEAEGRWSMTIEIKQTDENGIVRTLNIKQKSTLRTDSVEKIDTSVLYDALAVLTETAGPKLTSSAAITVFESKTNNIKKMIQSAKENKVTLKFSELLALRDLLKATDSQLGFDAPIKLPEFKTTAAQNQTAKETAAIASRHPAPIPAPAPAPAPSVQAPAAQAPAAGPAPAAEAPKKPAAGSGEGEAPAAKSNQAAKKPAAPPVAAKAKPAPAGAHVEGSVAPIPSDVSKTSSVEAVAFPAPPANSMPSSPSAIGLSGGLNLDSTGESFSDLSQKEPSLFEGNNTPKRVGGVVGH